MPEVCYVQRFGVVLIKGLDPVHLQLRSSEFGQQSLLPLPLRTVPLPANLCLLFDSMQQKLKAKVGNSCVVFFLLLLAPRKRKLEQIHMSPAKPSEKKWFKSLL